jgi:phosphotriesterase-related protein
VGPNGSDGAPGPAARATVESLTGPLAVDELGVTFMHEHVFVMSPEMQAHWPGYNGWDEDAQVEVARRKLHDLHHVRGCRTIVDPSVPGLGRNARAIARAAEGTGLQVILATGFYVFGDLPLAFSLKSREDKHKKLVELFSMDVEHGLDGTGIKPGFLKCATDARGLTDDVETVLRAVAEVHRETGLPILTHTHSATRRGEDQIRIFREEGVDLGAVLIGHCNESDDVAYLEGLLEAGVFIGFDRCGKISPVATREEQMDHLATLLGRGHADGVVLAHDHTSFLDWFEPGQLEQMPDFWPWGYVTGHLLPGLRERGVPDEEIEQMLVGNPRAFFSRGG